MATNKVYERGVALSLVCSHPTTPASGDPVRIGKIAGVATTAERADGTTSVDFEGVYNLLVDDDLGTGVTVGSKLYYHDTGTGAPTTTCVNNRDTTTLADAFIGYALEAIAANGTAIIKVLLGHGAGVDSAV